MRERLDSFAGSQDIVEGNTKLILGLMWSIVQRYQIALKTKIPPKKLVMAWMQVGETVLLLILVGFFLPGDLEEL